MFSVFISIAIGIGFLAFGAYLSEKYYNEIDDFFVGLGVLFIFGISWLLPLISGGLATNWDRYDKADTTPIVSLRNDTQINGSAFGIVFIMSGNINQTPVYFYYTQNPDGGLEQHNIPTANVALYEDAPKDTGYIKTIYTYGKLSDNQPYRHWCFLNKPYDYPEKTVKQIHIPQGTLIRQFKVN